MTTATASAAELADLLKEWRAFMAASRPRWASVDLTFTQLRALSTIARRGPMRVSELAEEFSIGLAAASALADRMARRRLITRRPDADDRRIVLLETGPLGRALLDRLERGSKEHFGKLIERMNPDEREALKTTLRAFVRLSADHTITKEEPHGLVIVRRRAGC